MSRDPRSSSKLSARDVEALLFIGEGYEVAQYQLHEAVFRRRSEVVVSRFVRRWIARGFLLAERWNNIGVNRLRLTSLGRDELVSRGIAKASQLFAPRKGVALKDIAHTLWINDLRIVFRQCVPEFNVVLPAWALQRRFSPVPRAIPDVLVVRSPQGDDAGRLVAAEVDLGGERLNAIFLPKLARLQKLVREWAANAPSQIVVFTRGAQRAALLEQFAAQIPEVPISVALLPEQNGRDALKVLREVIAARVDGVNSGCSDDLIRFSHQEEQIEQLTGDDGVRLLEEEVEYGTTTSTVGFPTTREECHRRMAELQEEGREIHLRLLQDDDDKQFLWRRLGMIRDYVAEIERALSESAE